MRLIVPYPPGGNVDSAARIVADKLQEATGQPFVVENKAGAGGLVAGEYFKKADPDGYTFFVGANGPVLFAPLIAGREAYNWRHDFIPITTISMTPIVLEVNPAVPAKNLAELLALARKEPGKLTMASPGIGTSNHLLSELMQSSLKLQWVTVQYRGNAPATNDLIGGQVQFAFDQISVALPFITSGKVRALAVTSPKRTSWLPDVPTFSELGYKDFNAQTFTGIFAPAKTPEPIVNKMHDLMAKVLSDPAVKDRFNKIGAEATVMSRADFKKYLEDEDGKWVPIIKRINIKAQ
ncbi:MAG: Bug family tripartite tricarboxylate transporter substrate binding protein [Pseudolabrys sp.]